MPITISEPLAVQVKVSNVSSKSRAAWDNLHRTILIPRDVNGPPINQLTEGPNPNILVWTLFSEPIGNFELDLGPA